MIRLTKNVLVSGTAICLSAASALSQESLVAVTGSTTATGIHEPLPAAPANIGEIAPQFIDLYQTQMRAAMSITDPPRRDAAVASAREQLARNIGKPVTVGTIANLDGILDIGGVSPQLGATG